MGSSAKTAEETVDYLRQQGEKAGAFMDLVFSPKRCAENQEKTHVFAWKM